MLLCFGDNRFRNTKPSPDQEHPIATVLKVNSPDRVRIACKRRRKVGHVGAGVNAFLFVA